MKVKRSSVALAGLAVVIAAALTATSLLALQAQSPKRTTTTYQFDPAKETWVSTVESVPLPRDPDGPPPQGGHTIIIYLDEDNPVREIRITEALIIDPDNGPEPLLEIAGHQDPGTGKINIGRLVFERVDAEQLDIDAKVVRTTLENVVAEDDELDLDLDVVNVVRTGRGAASRLFLGIGRDELRIEEEFEVENLTKRENGLRVDRIRILGPNTGRGFIEELIVSRTSVFGEIRVKDVEIQDLILRNVSLDDSF